MTINETKAVKSFFRNQPRFGRTTTLVCKATGDVLGTWIGVLTRAECWKNYEYQCSK